MSEDNQMAVAARKVIIGNWFDVSRVRVRVTRGIINLQGHLEKLAGEKPSLDQMKASLEKMDQELRAVRGFRGVAYLFDNWTREGTGGWRFAGPRSELEKLRSGR